jgi:hypothetical protein
MSLFGYPATVTHYKAEIDNWNRAYYHFPEQKSAKVIEEQKIIKNGKGEEIQSIAEIHLEGPQHISFHDYFEYVNGIGEKMRFDVQHIESKKEMGTDNIKKVVIYA